MNTPANTVVEVCNSRYEELCSRYTSGENSKIINRHFGEFSQDLVNTISSDVEVQMLNSGDKKGIVKRMFSILVEGLQNIRLHGEKDDDGHQTSFVSIGQNDDSYEVAIGNLIFNKNVEGIKRRILEVNEVDQADIKKLYMEVLTNGIISSKGGAGLGFITMAMKSKNRLDYFFDKINDNLTCFTLVIKIDRLKKEQL